jgi:beta-glucosidase
MSNRTYRYFGGEVLYPFGYGLSYTTFEYRNARVSEERVPATGRVEVSVDVTNTGERDAEEVVQLYLSRPDEKGAPIRSLVGFERIPLKSGDTRTVRFTLAGRALSSVDADGDRRINAGRVDLWIGGGQPERRAGLSPVAGDWVAFEITSSGTLPK